MVESSTKKAEIKNCQVFLKYGNNTNRNFILKGSKSLKKIKQEKPRV